jgi:hypothetical protein
MRLRGMLMGRGRRASLRRSMFRREFIDGWMQGTPGLRTIEGNTRILDRLRSSHRVNWWLILCAQTVASGSVKFESQVENESERRSNGGSHAFLPR